MKLNAYQAKQLSQLVKTAPLGIDKDAEVWETDKPAPIQSIFMAKHLYHPVKGSTTKSVSKN